MKIKDLELVAGSCLDCAFHKTNWDCCGAMKENGIIESELDKQVGDCCSGDGDKCYKLKQKENQPNEENTKIPRR